MKDVDLEDLLESLGEKISEELALRDLDKKLSAEADLIEMYPFGMMSGQGVGSPIFIFKDESEAMNLPVSLGSLQSSIVALGLGPNLGSSIFGFCNKLLKSSQIEISRVVFDKIRDGRLMAKLEVKVSEELKTISGSAEEILALALESGADFFTTEEIVDKLKSQELEKEKGSLDNLDASNQETAGQKYIM